MPHLPEMKQEDIYPQGPFTAWSVPSGMTAVVKNGEKIIKRITGETAWADAVRYAEDQNLKASMK